MGGTGIYIHDSFQGAANGKVLVLNSDMDASGDGTLTIANERTVNSNHGDIQVTAWDIDMMGSLTAGNKTLTVHGAVLSQTIGLGIQKEQPPPGHGMRCLAAASNSIRDLHAVTPMSACCDPHVYLLWLLCLLAVACMLCPPAPHGYMLWLSTPRVIPSLGLGPCLICVMLSD